MAGPNNSDESQSSRAKKNADGALRQARVTTDSGDEMLELLKGRKIELVGRGPHRVADGTFVAEIIATPQELSKLPKDKVEIRPQRRTLARAAQLSKGDRYLEEGSVPRGVGVKE